MFVLRLILFSCLLLWVSSAFAEGDITQDSSSPELEKKVQVETPSLQMNKEVVNDPFRDKEAEISKLFLQKVYPGRNYNIPQLKRESYERLERGRHGTKTERLGVFRWCGRAKVLYCYGLLVEALFDNDVDIRDEVANALGRLKLSQALPTLLKALESEKNALVKARLLYAIGTSGDASQVNILLNELSSENSKIRKFTIEGLGQLGAPKAIPALQDRFNLEKDSRVSLELLRSILLIDNKQQQERSQLLEMLKSLDPLIRLKVGEYIIELGISESYIPLQKALLVESDPDVRSWLYKAYKFAQTAVFIAE